MFHFVITVQLVQLVLCYPQHKLTHYQLLTIVIIITYSNPLYYYSKQNDTFVYGLLYPFFIFACLFVFEKTCHMPPEHSMAWVSWVMPHISKLWSLESRSISTRLQRPVLLKVFTFLIPSFSETFLNFTISNYNKVCFNFLKNVILVKSKIIN